MRPTILTVAFVFLAPAAALGQSIIFDVAPENPTTNTRVSLVVDSCRTILIVRIQGQTIEIRSGPPVNNCFAALVLMPVDIGYLLPGKYTARIVDITPQGEIEGPSTQFVVTLAPEHVPALQPLILFALATTMVFVATKLLRNS